MKNHYNKPFIFNMFHGFLNIQDLSKLGKSPEAQGIAGIPVIHTCGETCG